MFLLNNLICDPLEYVMLKNVLQNDSTGNKNNLNLSVFCYSFKELYFPPLNPNATPPNTFNPFINWSRLCSKAKNGSFTLCLHISLCCINNASKSERHKSHMATGWQNRDWASVLEGVKAELGLVLDKSPHNSIGKLSYYKRRGTESACQCCCTEKKNCTTPFSHFWCMKVFRIFNCNGEEVRENWF